MNTPNPAHDAQACETYANAYREAGKHSDQMERARHYRRALAAWVPAFADTFAEMNDLPL